MVSLCNYYLGYYAILFGSNVFTLLRGAKYDIVVTSGIMFILIAMNLSMSLYENYKLKYLKMILLGLSIGFIVLSKPNLIVYYLLIGWLLFNSMKELNTKEKIKDIVIISIPLGILAIFQMYLNYVRFDSIFEFGAKYQLTSFNMTSCMSITFGKVIGGLLQYIFRTPNINPMKFPFVFVNKDTSLVSMNEVCYENRLVGLIGIAILVIYLFKNYILKDEKELKHFINIEMIICILAMIIATSFGGICEAYSIDLNLYLANMEGKYAIPLSQIKAIKSIKKTIRIMEWNKDEEIQKLKEEGDTIHFITARLMNIEGCDTENITRS